MKQTKPSEQKSGLLFAVKKKIKSMPLIAIPGVFVNRVLSGFKAYKKILTACPSSEGWRIYFMDYDGSGDTYLTCGYLQAKGLIGERDAFAGSGSLSLKIAKLFHFARYVQIKPKVALNVRLMERFYGRRLELLPLLYESDYLEYSGILRRMAGHRGLDFMSMLKIGLEVNCGVPFEDGPWTQPEFPYAPAEVDEIFQTYGLLPGKTVLLAPYAGKSDMWGIPMDFYEELAQRLRTMGFSVCTNSSGPDKEPPVPGTTPLLVPHYLMSPFCERAGYFIGLRSGLCDIISAAKGCKKIILSGEMIIPSVIVSHQEFFSLKKMKLCSDAIEIKCQENDPRALADRIIELF